MLWFPVGIKALIKYEMNFLKVCEAEEKNTAIQKGN